jgi:hypothetical protein
LRLRWWVRGGAEFIASTRSCTLFRARMSSSATLATLDKKAGEAPRMK